VDPGLTPPPEAKAKAQTRPGEEAAFAGVASPKESQSAARLAKTSGLGTQKPL